MIFADWSTAVEVCTRLGRRMQVRYRITRTEEGRWLAEECGLALTASETRHFLAALAEQRATVSADSRSAVPHSSASQPSEAPESHRNISRPSESDREISR